MEAGDGKELQGVVRTSVGQAGTILVRENGQLKKTKRITQAYAECTPSLRCKIMSEEIDVAHIAHVIYVKLSYSTVHSPLIGLLSSPIPSNLHASLIIYIYI